MTFGWSVNSGMPLTKPTSFTMRFTRSRSPPQASFSWAMMLMAQMPRRLGASSTRIVLADLALIFDLAVLQRDLARR